MESLNKDEAAGAKPAAPPAEYIVRVLLVDDQAMIGEAVRRMLLDEPGVEFHFCSEAREAMATALRVRPTVILQDLVMPGRDGLTLLREYRATEETANVPVVVLSTREEPVTKSEAFAVGASDYLVKLPDKIELIARVRHHSRAYLNQVQRDMAYRALRASQQELMEKNIELQRLTNVDGLTGLSNRRYLDEFLVTEWQRAMREQTPLSMLMSDIDHFKRYNDTYGHIRGDEVLKGVAEALQFAGRRPADLAARYGGEEFALIMPATLSDGAAAQAEKFRGSVEAMAIPHSASTTSRIVTVSAGCATIIPAREDSVIRLIQTADEALYEAKRGGRNRVVCKDLTR